MSGQAYPRNSKRLRKAERSRHFKQRQEDDAGARRSDGSVAPKKWRCARSGKWAFQSKGDALIGVTNLTSVTGYVRAYKCPHGDHWHITSKREIRLI